MQSDDTWVDGGLELIVGDLCHDIVHAQIHHGPRITSCRSPLHIDAAQVLIRQRLDHRLLHTLEELEVGGTVEGLTYDAKDFIRSLVDHILGLMKAGVLIAHRNGKVSWDRCVKHVDCHIERHSRYSLCQKLYSTAKTFVVSGLASRASHNTARRQ